MDVAELSNQALVNRLARAGPDDPAWLEFISRFHLHIRRIIYRAYACEAMRNPRLDKAPPREAVDDLTQEVFVRLLAGGRRALAQFRGLSDKSIYTYLHTIATNLVRDHFKALRAQRKPPAATSLSEPLRSADGPVPGLTLGDHLPSTDPGPDKVAEAQELETRISEALRSASRGTASVRDRLIFRLFFIEGLKMDEIASIGAIGLSTSGVEKRIRKIRALAESLVKKKGG